MESNRGTLHPHGVMNFSRGGKNSSKPTGFRREQPYQHSMNPNPSLLGDRHAQSMLARQPFPFSMQAPGPPMMPQQGYQSYVPQFPSNRGIRRPPTSTSQQQLHLPLVHGSKGGTDTSGRGAPLSFTCPSYPNFNMYSTPAPTNSIPMSLVPPTIPMNKQPAWVPTGLIMEHPLPPLLDHMPPPLFQSPMNLPFGSPGFGVPTAHSPAYSSPSLPAQWQQNGTTYYDPNQGYTNEDIPFKYNLQQSGSRPNICEHGSQNNEPIIEHGPYHNQHFSTGTPSQFYEQEDYSYSANNSEILCGFVPPDTSKKMVNSTDKTADSIFIVPHVTPLLKKADVKPPESFTSISTANSPVKLETNNNGTIAKFQPVNNFKLETKSDEIQLSRKLLPSDKKLPHLNKAKPNKPITDYNTSIKTNINNQDNLELMKLDMFSSTTQVQTLCSLLANEKETAKSRPIVKTPSKHFDYHYGENRDGRNSGQQYGHGRVKGPTETQAREAPQQHERPALDSTTIDFKELNRQAEEFRQKQLDLMVPLVKDVYCEASEVANLTDDQVNMIRESKNAISVHYVGADELSELRNPNLKVDTSGQIPIPNPVVTFEQCFRLYPEIMQEINKQGFSEPSPVQCQMWPCILKGMDVVGIAQTGSGKTLAFLIPALLHIEKQLTPREQRKGPTVLILAPTRELAQQIDKEVKKYSYKNIRSVCVYGGGSRHEQIEAVRLQTEIVIATPGRLNDLVHSESLNLSEVSMLILDEADEMLDQGFEPQINRALLKVRGDRQTILTSATWPASVRRMARNYTKNPLMVVVGTVDIRAVTTVKQNIIFLEPEERFNWVVDFIKAMDPNDKAIIFVGKKAMVDHFSSELSLQNITVQSIHGGHCQEDREQAIADMKDGHARILVATDVAARGIDIDNVTHIINHDFPNSVEQYVHRIGRTGRAGKKGESHTFIGRRDWGNAKQLIDILKHASQEVPDQLVTMAERFENRRQEGGGGFRGGRGGRRGGWEDRGGFNFNRGGGDFRGGRGRFNDNNESAGRGWGNRDGFAPGRGRAQRY